MKASKTLICVLTFAFALVALPAFAQHGIGAVVSAQTHTNVGAGTSVGAGTVHAGGANAGVSPHADVHATTSVQGHDHDADVHADGKSGIAAGANIATHIESNPQLTAHVESLLPKGESISTASAGFKSEGQFLAALHASHNLNIPFDQLKAKMTGKDAMSLGAAIHALKPDMKESEAKEEAKKADADAKTTTTSSTTAKTHTSSK
jgi:hypothetical protein